MKTDKAILGKLIIEGEISLKTPLLIGCGVDDNSDIDVIKDKNGNPFIPATSAVGVLRHIAYDVCSKEDGLFSRGELDFLWGSHKDKRSIISLISCSDMRVKEEKGSSQDYYEIRDGIRINNKTGITKDKGKFDFETVKVGTKFSFHFEIDLVEKRGYGEDYVKKAGHIIYNILTDGMKIGAKTNVGFGNAALSDGKMYYLDFSKKKDIINWLKGKYDDENLLKAKKIELRNDDFILDIALDIKNSLIIRSYPKDPKDPDSIHLESNGNNILPGTSIKGALRAQAVKILNVIYDNNSEETKILIYSLFGCSARQSAGDKTKQVDKKLDIPSRVIVEEVDICNVRKELQYRIKIDRFTGGVIAGSLFDSVPVFSLGLNSDTESNIKNLRITVKFPTDSDKGLMLLLLKDLWTGNLAIGGEKNIGRGVFIGKKVTIQNLSKRRDCIKFHNINEIIKNNDVEGLMRGFVKKLCDKADKDYYIKRKDRYLA